MKPALVVPEELMTRFQFTAMERLERIDSAWAALVHGEVSTLTAADFLRDVHTIKGDAKVLGLVETSLLCQRLEDLLTAARDRKYRVHEDVDVVVTMTVQFISMLVRQRGMPARGIDLVGFNAQIDEVTKEYLSDQTAAEATVTVRPRLRVKDGERTASAASLRLTSAASAIYIEHLRSGAEGKARLYEAWRALLANLIESRKSPLAPLVESQLVAAKKLAAELGKSVLTSVEGDDIAVALETADVIRVALVHGLRNAVDHGIETPEQRAALGKPAAGLIDVRLTRSGLGVELVVRDDGGGIDLEVVRRRATVLDLLEADVPASPEQIVECLFAAGFSTRDAVSDISGRGIGLDAVRAAAVEHGGWAKLEASPGAFTQLIVNVPDAQGTVEVTSFVSPLSGTRFAFPPPVTVRPSPRRADLALEDVLQIPYGEGDSMMALEVVGAGLSFTVAAAAPPSRARALRRFLTEAEDLTEVVWIDGREAVLFRPAPLHAITSRGDR